MRTEVCCVLRYQTRSDYRRREELRRERETRREREVQDETELRRLAARDRAVQTEYLEKSSRSRQQQQQDKYRDSRDFSGGQARHRDNDRRDRRDVSKKARDRDRRYGTDSYKSRKTSSARFESFFVCVTTTINLLDLREDHQWFMMTRKDT